MIAILNKFIGAALYIYIEDLHTYMKKLKWY